MFKKKTCEKTSFQTPDSGIVHGFLYALRCRWSWIITSGILCPTSVRLNIHLLISVGKEWLKLETTVLRNRLQLQILEPNPTAQTYSFPTKVAVLDDFGVCGYPKLRPTHATQKFLSLRSPCPQQPAMFLFVKRDAKEIPHKNDSSPSICEKQTS